MNYSAHQYPSAFISLFKNRVSHTAGNPKKVYLSESREFEIELFNSYRNTVLAKIRINGDYISNSGIVLRPGERVFLERYLDTDRKFFFDIYEIPNTPEAKNATVLNGLVEVEFYEEYVLPVVTWTSTYTYPTHTYTTYDSAPWTTCSGGYSNNTIGASVSSVYVTNTSGILTDAKSAVDPQRSMLRSAATTVTGRVDQGDHSNQTFRHSDKRFNSFILFTDRIQILPAQNKISDEIKSYCVSCGRRFRKAEKYCSACGTRK